MSDEGGELNEDDEIWADDESTAGIDEDAWQRNDPFFDEPEPGASWNDNEGNLHELQTGETGEGYESRGVFGTFDEAVNYITGIFTGADQYFDIYSEVTGYEVFYIGGSD
jgi:hypothetical protein